MVPKSQEKSRSSLSYDPTSFEFMSPMTPSSGKVYLSLRKKSQRLSSLSLITQFVQPSMKILPPIPPSAPPLKHHQFQPLNHQPQTNFMKPGQSQVKLPSLHSQVHYSHFFQQYPLRSQTI